MKSAVRCAAVAVSLLAFAGSARAELTPWDQAKVTELGKQLETATNELFQAFRRQPAPTKGTSQRAPYFQLQQEIRHLRREARSMSRALQRGADLEETQPSWQSMMQTVRTAQDRARRVFSGADVQERANAAREILNQLAPYFDPNATPLQPVGR
jgi:hypothetical protein